ncbi:hypothetical protein QN277_022810 [Acacia crassicarpa]|uniref:Uncharacterized protein n=1 Tax=Acacia crassicarpa TaxID=499986 RepID=A0AAE1JKH2_9FABA|nr:hypothetical protein QN277_022810 [Acacia crassicarpa]
MALYQTALLPYATLSFRNKMLPSITTSRSVPRTIQCTASTTIVSDQTNTSRRNVNFFQPSIWPHDYIQSLRSDFVEESHAVESDGLQEKVRVMLSKLENPGDQLELIDILQRLGVEAHFRHEIRNLIENIYNNKDTSKKKSNLHATALEFRILRQHGYGVSSEVFKKFLDHEDHFDVCFCVDIMGLLSLYEASFLSMEGETILDEARDFSSTCLREFVDKNINNEDDETCLLVKHALELPLHWRVSRSDARWFIDFYEKREDMSPTLLKLAKLDFNMVQVSHLEDLKDTSRWWERIGLLKNMSFTRDRLVENFFWTVGYNYEPQYGHYRRVLTKVNALITAIDDVYDVYGTLEELELFTDVVDRWDVNAMDILPDYMKICFLALYNFVHEEALEFLKENGHNVIPLLRKMWADLCKAYLVEAKWFNSNYKPSLHDYLENAWISSSGPVILVHSYLLLQSTTTTEDLFCFQEYSDIIRFSSIILRLTDDLGSSQREKETGDVAKAIECYMNETGASEADACRHINCLISETWKKFNKEASNSSYPKSFIEVARNLARVSHCMYEHGDGHSIQAPQIKNRIMSLLFHPVV